MTKRSKDILLKIVTFIIGLSLGFSIHQNITNKYVIVNQNKEIRDSKVKVIGLKSQIDVIKMINQEFKKALDDAT